MDYQEFRKAFFESVCFTSNQVFAWQPGFHRNNLSRWVQKGLLTKLRNSYYSFPEYGNNLDYVQYVANRIYRPSYISLHTALAFYGLIPEAIPQITSVSTLKTAYFENLFGTYSYKTIKPELMFGYDPKPIAKGFTLLFAKPEKALLDLLYLYPFYNTRQEIEALRLDVDFMEGELNVAYLKESAARFKNKKLESRAGLILKTYNL